MRSRHVLALALTLCLPAGLSAGEEAKQEPGKQEKEPAEDEFRSKLEALRKLLDEPGSVRVVQPLLEPPPGPWKAVEGVAKAEDGSAPDVRFAEDLERQVFQDRTPLPFLPSGLKKCWDEWDAKWRTGPPVPPSLEAPVLLDAKAGESRRLLVTDGTGLAAYDLGKEGPALVWARRIVYDSELVVYMDRSPIAFRVAALSSRFREKRETKDGEPAPRKLLAVEDLLGFSIAACPLDGPRHLILTVAKADLCAYLLNAEGGELSAVRRVFYDFELRTYPPGEAARMKEAVSCVLKGKDEVAAKDRWIGLVAQGDTAYVILCVKGAHCFYEIRVPAKPASPEEKGIAFMGAWKRE
ncbi:MAG: hypothetical protein MUC63_00945 [Planctomycetes bacterium]|jgi:hypothetical protein|nr:hypothetical protein [Planctomycetota bacterium]